MSFSCGTFSLFLFFFFLLMIDILSAIFIPPGVIGKSLEIMVFICFSVQLLFSFGWARLSYYYSYGLYGVGYRYMQEAARSS